MGVLLDFNIFGYPIGESLPRKNEHQGSEKTTRLRFTGEKPTPVLEHRCFSFLTVFFEAIFVLMEFSFGKSSFGIWSHVFFGGQLVSEIMEKTPSSHDMKTP